jgi:hypothetical protein
LPVEYVRLRTDVPLESGRRFREAHLLESAQFTGDPRSSAHASRQIGAKPRCSVVDSKSRPMIAGLIDRVAMVFNSDRDVVRLLLF